MSKYGLTGYVASPTIAIVGVWILQTKAFHSVNRSWYLSQTTLARFSQKKIGRDP